MTWNSKYLGLYKLRKSLGIRIGEVYGYRLSVGLHKPANGYRRPASRPEPFLAGRPTPSVPVERRGPLGEAY